MPSSLKPGTVKFGLFEADLERLLLTKQGLRVKIQEQPFHLLALLLERSGEILTREEIRQKLWAADTFVEFDDGLNTAIRKLRQALGDNAEKPRFIETVTGKGYRFIAKIDHAGPEEAAPALIDHPGVLLVVLPFENLSRDPNETYLSDGIADELTTRLGEATPTHLGVMGRTTARECQRRGLTVEQMGRELGAHFVIEGSVRGGAERTRINARLVRVRDQVQVWAKSYERKPGSLLEWQLELAREIASAVKIAVPAGRRESASRMRAVEPLAYDYYLRGLHYWNKRTPPGCIQAIPLFEKAIDIDPTYALPYTGLADAFILLAIHGVRSPEDTYPKARAAAAKALEIDPSLAEAHVALADISKGFDWDWGRAEAGYREAIRLNSNYGLAHQWYANLLSIRERHEEAVREAEDARRLDPLSAPAAGFVAFTLYRARRFEQALKEVRRAMDLNPSSAVVNWFHALIRLQRGENGLAQEAADAALKESQGGSMFLATVGYALGRSGKRAAALEVAQSLERRLAEHYVSPLDLCVAYAGVDRRRAVEWLEKATRQRVMRVTELGMPLFDDLRAGKGFPKIATALA